MQYREDGRVPLGRSLGHSGTAVFAGGSADGRALIDAIMVSTQPLNVVLTIDEFPGS